MRIIFAIMLLAGLGLAGFAAKTFMGQIGILESQRAAAEEKIIAVTDVFVVTRQLRYGDVLQPEDVAAISWPASNIPDGALTAMDDIFPPGNDGRRTVLRLMERDEPLLQVKLTQPGAEAGLAAALTPGMRAFTLQVDVTTGVAGFLRPGDRVDVYWTGGGSSGNQGGLTRLIQASLPLIAIDQQTDEQNGNPSIARNVTVEAKPDVVAKLAQAQATGRLTLALVGVRDEIESAAVQATQEQVLGPREVVEQAEPVETCGVRTRKGGSLAGEIPVACGPFGG